MTKDKIRRLVAECEAVLEFARECGLYFYPDLHGFSYDDLKLAENIFGSEIGYCTSADDPFYYLEVGDVTLYA